MDVQTAHSAPLLPRHLESGARTGSCHHMHPGSADYAQIEGCPCRLCARQALSSTKKNVGDHIETFLRGKAYIYTRYIDIPAMKSLSSHQRVNCPQHLPLPPYWPTTDPSSPLSPPTHARFLPPKTTSFHPNKAYHAHLLSDKQTKSRRYHSETTPIRPNKRIASLPPTPGGADGLVCSHADR